MKNLILKFAPVFFQNLAITLFNSYQYMIRRSGRYRNYRNYFSYFDDKDAEVILGEQSRRLAEFLEYAKKNSKYYSKICGSELSDFPILEKVTLLEKLDEISTVEESNSIVSLTGGTTGASMKVLYTKEDIQERHAILDHFRAGYGYTLGCKVAWFSGKDLTRPKDLVRGICYRDDWINKIRFFSTFHINSKNFRAYWDAFLEFSPEFLVGFPSSVYELCLLAKENGYKYNGMVKAFFPTAETVLPVHREVISEVLGCPLVDQYASSEGAPFILQCSKGRLHIHSLTGVFEVVDSEMRPAKEGEILVTSFSTRGTPLIRYRIGDRIKLSGDDEVCECGCSFPMVDYIDGRSSDYIFSPDNGRVNLGNLSNCTKDAPGIMCFQMVQEDPERVVVNIVKGAQFTPDDERKFLGSMRKRLGQSMEIDLVYVDSIPREKSGKFRMVKNNLNLKN